MGVKASQLPADSAPTGTDYLILLDTETNTLKKVLVSDLFSQALIGTSGLANGAVTSAKIETQASWTAPTFQNSWVNYDIASFAPAGYMKDSLGFVHLRGLIKSGTVSTGIPCFTLPVGYRPNATTVRLLIGTHASGAMGRVDIYANGAVCVEAGSNAYVQLDNIHFKAEQ